jgi:hypothetical protein
MAREQAEAMEAVQKYEGWAHNEYEFVNCTLTFGHNPWAPIDSMDLFSGS